MKKVQVGDDQENAQSERKKKKTKSLKKLNCYLCTSTKKTYHKPSEQLFPNRRPFIYPNLTNQKTNGPGPVNAHLFDC